MGLTQEQIADRRRGITATDVAAIAGVHPYRSAIDVYFEKHGRSAPFDGNQRTERGNDLEPLIRRGYEKRHGVFIDVPGTLTHPDFETHKATPDGLVFLSKPPAVYRTSDAERGHEIKTHTFFLRGGYGAAGSDEVPAYEFIQCAWNMHVAELDVWDLTACIDLVDTDYRLHRDLDFEAGLMEIADRFWTDSVVGGAMPSPDGSSSYSEWLKREFPESMGGSIEIDSSHPVFASISGLRDVRSKLKRETKTKERLEQEIKVLLGDAEILEFPALEPGAERERIKWKAGKARVTTDWKSAFAEMASLYCLVCDTHPDAEFETPESVSSRHTKTGPRARPLIVPSWDTNGDGK